MDGIAERLALKGIPVVRSKLIMPQLPPVIMVSERLRRLCSEILERRTVILTAPAGYGKTTLLVNALNAARSEGCRICWYRLDESDRDLAVFYTHLVETLFPEEEHWWDEPRSYLADCGDIFAQHQYLNALFCQELWAFHNHRPDVKTFIVFDDFHLALDTPAVAGAVQFFSDNLPGSCAVYVSSRWETGLLAGKRSLARDALALSQQDLCFSEDELAAFISERYGVVPDQGLLRSIMQHTEGWPAGIILVCQMLSVKGADQTGSFLDRSGENEPLFQYITAEVLKTADDRLLRFLVKAAILSELTASEAVAITGEGNASELLKLCEHKGLFIQKISGRAHAPALAGTQGGHQPTYRFHSLFRESLQQIQLQYLSPEEVQHYHLKAANYYIEHHNFDRALEQLILCGSVDQAVALVTRESARLIALESLDQLRLWFKILPEEGGLRQWPPVVF